MAWVMIGSAVIGGALANNAAKQQSKAISTANAQNNQYLNAVMPDIKENIGNVKGFYNDMLAKGPYQGDFYAGPNQMQTDAINSMYNVGNANVNFGTNLMNDASGFVGNASDLYSQYSNLANRPDMMAQADQYAQDNMSPIVQAMMRDQKRTLTEQTLPGINKAASGSGNVNSSRAGVADAIATRDYQDRLADVSTDVYNSLRDSRLSQGNTEFNQTLNALSGAGGVNNTLGNAFTTGANMATTGAGTALNAGNAMNTLDQGQLDADRAQYDYLNNYNYNLGKDYQGFLTGNNITGNYQMNAVSPGAATIGGAMSGYGFGTDYLSGRPGGFGNQAFFDPLFGGGPGLGNFRHNY